MLAGSVAPGCLEIASHLSNLYSMGVFEFLCEGVAWTDLELQVNRIAENVSTSKRDIDLLTSKLSPDVLQEDLSMLKARAFCDIKPGSDFSYKEMSHCFKENKLSNVKGMKFIRSIHIPAGVEILSGGCFSGCGSLSRVTFASGSRLKCIESSAFSSCTSLREIEIPADVEIYGDIGCSVRRK